MALSATYRSLLWPIFIPTFLYFFSTRAALILLPLYVLKQGGSPALAALVISLRGVGMLCADVPAGFITARLGDKGGMLLGALCGALSLLVIALLPVTAVFVCGALLSGISFAQWMVARLSYISDHCPAQLRGRAIAFTASLQRCSGIAGPAIAGFVATRYGFVSALLLLVAAFVAAALVGQLCCQNSPERIPVHSGQSHGAALLAVIRDNLSLFLTSGIGAIGLMSLRGAGPMLLPLFGAALGLRAEQIGLVASLTTVLEFVMFIPAGFVMDRWGRKYTLIPGTFIMAASLVVFALSQGLTGYVGGSLLMACGNGLATGVIMAIGTDLAPEQGRGQFLGSWRFVSDIGFTGGPLLITVLMGIFSLGFSSMALGMTASCFAMVMALRAPESLRSKG